MRFARTSLLLPLLVLLALAPAAPAAAAEDPVLLTLQKVKAAYSAKEYDRADEALGHLSELVAAPEREAIRPKVLPALLFYTGAVAYARQDEDRARTALRQYFALEPNSSLDPAMYPKSFRIFFEAQRTEAAREAAPAGPESIAGGVLPEYATRDLEEGAVPANTGAEEWGEGPVKYLMDPDEKKAFRAAADDDERRSFVNAFWQKRDPSPETAENEFQREFYRRVQYADANFSTEATRGALSDRGMVFLLLGPPSYVGRSAIRTSQDTMNYLRQTEVRWVQLPTGQVVAQRVPSNRVPLTPGATEGEMETWYYRRDRVMKGLPYAEIQYQFVTKRGYGEGVLQKEPVPLTALRQAAKLIQKP